MFKGLSLFASAGIAEMNLSKCNIDIKIANELIPIRCKVHEYWNPKTKVICGDITKDELKQNIINESIKENIDFILATPPCQGVSLIGKNKSNDDMLRDERNFLIFHAFDIVDAIKPKVIVIENVARFLGMKFPYNGNMYNIESILKDKYGSQYSICVSVYNAADYGIPQNRLRTIMVLCQKGYSFVMPKKLKPITVRDAIGYLPSIEAGEKTKIIMRENILKIIFCG